MPLYFVVLDFVIHQLIRVVYILDRLYVQYMYISFKGFFCILFKYTIFVFSAKREKLDSFGMIPYF